MARGDRDRERFVHTLAAMVDQHHVRCHAWVLMSNHYHLLLETPRANRSDLDSRLITLLAAVSC
ncbi:MAG TPA: hypothetical protein VJO34_04140 [Methylomirabilota bacterium]|nr:hypothetical protein [Methylomirabilota bacterium]